MSPKRYKRYLDFLGRKRMRRMLRRNKNYDQYQFRPRRQQSQAIPYSSSRSKFTSTPIENNGLRVSGYDMVYDMTEVQVDETSGLFVSIPANPAYWTGTRVAQLAVAYSQYRPIYMRFDYFPSVSMQDRGTVTSGTVWNEAPTSGSLSQALTTSNTGKTHTVWTKTKSRVKVGNNLDQNLYDMSGTFDDDTNPYIFLAVVNDQEQNRVPGYYMCQYTFEFKNPIGDGNEYEHEIKPAGEITTEDVWESTTAVLRSNAEAFGPGTVLTVQVIAGVVQFLLKGSRLGVAADLVFDLFKNRNRRVAQAYGNEDRYVYQFCSGSGPGPNYVIGNGDEPITRNMFNGFVPEANKKLYGWGFTMNNDEVRSFYFHNHTLTDYDFEDPTNRETFKYLVLEGMGNGVFTSSLLNEDNGGPTLYSGVTTNSYMMFKIDGELYPVLLLHNKVIDIQFPDEENDEIVGSGNIKMKSRKY